MHVHCMSILEGRFYLVFESMNVTIFSYCSLVQARLHTITQKFIYTLAHLAHKIIIWRLSLCLLQVCGSRKGCRCDVLVLKTLWSERCDCRKGSFVSRSTPGTPSTSSSTSTPSTPSTPNTTVLTAAAGTLGKHYNDMTRQQ